MSRPTAVFVAGSRQIPRLPAEVRSRLGTMIEKGFQILVGDANGADKAVQRSHIKGLLAQGDSDMAGEQVIAARMNQILKGALNARDSKQAI
jgi:hypothetical protein